MSINEFCAYVFTESMSTNEFMGYFIAAIAVLVGISVPLINLIYTRSDKKKQSASDGEIKLEKKFDALEKSINEMNVSTALLTKSIEVLSDKINDSTKKEKELERQISTHSTTLTNHEVRIQALESDE